MPEDANRLVTVVFRVEDLDAAHRQALDAGAVPFHDPMPQPWGRSARYADHDGNIIELTEPGSPPQ